MDDQGIVLSAPAATASAGDITAQAIYVLRAGRCPTCNQVNAERQQQVSAGLGQGLKTETFFVCANPTCTNYGK